MDRLDVMEILVAVAEAGSLSAAGRKLGIPLPTVSRKIADLEAHLKTQVFVRSTRKLVLTEAGGDFLGAAKRILESVAEAEARAAGEYSAPRGELALTAPLVFGRLHVLPVVTEFLKQFPEINVQMTLSDRNASLIDDQIDVAVRIGALADSSMIAVSLGSIRRVVCGSPAYFSANGTPKTPEQLASHQCVTFSMVTADTSWRFAARGRRTKVVTPRQRLDVNTAEAAVDAAIAGLGLTRVLSYQVAQAVTDKKLKIVLQDFESPPVPVHLLHAAAKELLPLKMRRFIEFAAPRIRKSLSVAQKKLG